VRHEVTKVGCDRFDDHVRDGPQDGAGLVARRGFSFFDRKDYLKSISYIVGLFIWVLLSH